MPGVPFRSAEHGGDFIMLQKGGEILPDEFVHFTKPTEEQWNQYLDYALKEWGIDYLKEIVKEYEGKAEWEAYAKLAAEKIKAHEEKKK